MHFHKYVAFFTNFVWQQTKATLWYTIRRQLLVASTDERFSKKHNRVSRRARVYDLHSSPVSKWKYEDVLEPQVGGMLHKSDGTRCCFQIECLIEQLLSIWSIHKTERLCARNIPPCPFGIPFRPISTLSLFLPFLNLDLLLHTPRNYGMLL